LIKPVQKKLYSLEGTLTKLETENMRRHEDLKIELLREKDETKRLIK